MARCIPAAGLGGFTLLSTLDVSISQTVLKFGAEVAEMRLLDFLSFVGLLADAVETLRGHVPKRASGSSVSASAPELVPEVRETRLGLP